MDHRQYLALNFSNLARLRKCRKEELMVFMVDPPHHSHILHPNTCSLGTTVLLPGFKASVPLITAGIWFLRTFLPLQQFRSPGPLQSSLSEHVCVFIIFAQAEIMSRDPQSLVMTFCAIFLHCLYNFTQQFITKRLCPAVLESMKKGL